MPHLLLAAALLMAVTGGHASAQSYLWRIRAATDGIRSRPKTPSVSAVASAVTPSSQPSGFIGPDGNFHRYDDTESSMSDAEMKGLLIGLGVVAATSPVWLPAVVADDNFVRAGYFPAYPYAMANGDSMHAAGYRPENGERDVFDPQYLREWSVSGYVEDGNNLDGVNRISGSLAVDTSSRFGVSTHWDYLTEQCACGGTDDLLLGDVMVTYRAVQSPWFRVHTGLGGQTIVSRGASRWGVNAAYTADVFPVEPVALSFAGEVGTLHKALTTRLRMTAGVTWRHVEAFAGYDWLRVGGADLHGPTAGLRLWW